MKSGGALKPEPTGWKYASTFPGFCSHHDKRLFEPLEDAPFIASKEQCFLIAYRSLAKEIHAKHNSGRQKDLRRAEARNSAQKQAIVAAFNKGVDLAIRDLKRHKNRYDKVLLEKDWNSVRGLLIEFDGIFPIQCTGGLFPDVDVFGRPVQHYDWRGATPDSICFSSFAADAKSYFLLCWLADSDQSCARFAKAFEALDEHTLPAAIASFILQRTENCHFSPDWYDGLSEEGKAWCQAQGMSGLFWGDLPAPATVAEKKLFIGIGVKDFRYLI